MASREKTWEQWNTKIWISRELFTGYHLVKKLKIEDLTFNNKNTKTMSWLGGLRVKKIDSLKEVLICWFIKARNQEDHKSV